MGMLTPAPKNAIRATYSCKKQQDKLHLFVAVPLSKHINAATWSAMTETLHYIELRVQMQDRIIDLVFFLNVCFGSPWSETSQISCDFLV